MDKIIRLNGISKQFNNADHKIIAVNNVNIGFHLGESISITGPSGCGKTTLLNLIGLIQRPTSGNILVNSMNVVNYSGKESARLRNNFYGYVAQNYLLIDRYSVAENVEIPLLYAQHKLNKRIRRKRVMDILEKVGLTDKVNDDVKNLSGGQQQRVAIARALVNNPSVILADEPTGALDTRTGDEIMKLLLTLVDEGKTLIMVTHNQDIAKQCGINLKMLDGNIVG